MVLYNEDTKELKFLQYDYLRRRILTMTDSIKAALAELFATIVDFVKKIFAAEVGSIEDLLK